MPRSLKHSSKMRLGLNLGVGLTMLVTACGSQGSRTSPGPQTNNGTQGSQDQARVGDETPDTPGNGTTKGGADAQERYRVLIQMDAQQDLPVDSNETFALMSAGALDFSASLTGCQSGLQRSRITPATTDFFVQKNDTGCIFRIDELTYLGERFSFETQTNWNAGSSLESTGSNGGILRLRILSTLKPRITGDQTIAMTVSLASPGDGASVGPRVRAGVSIVGAEPLELEINTLDLSLVSDGSAQLSGVLGCSEPVTSTHCGGVALSALRLGLVPQAAWRMSLSECRAIALGTSGLPGGSGKLQGKAVPVGSPDAPNGGFSFSKLRIPAPLYAPSNQRLLLAGADTSSPDGACKYYEIEVRP